MNTRRHLTAAALLWALLGGVSAGHAQPPGTPIIRAGETGSGALTAADPRSPATGNRPFRLYRLDADSGRQYTISLRSKDFDALVRVMSTTGGLTSLLASNDDGGDGHDALLRYTPRTSGPLLIVVTASVGTGTGAYELVVNEVVPRPLVVHPLAIGDSVPGTLGDSSATTEEGTRYDVYQFRATRGRRLVMSVSSVALSAAGRDSVSDSTRPPRLSFGRIVNGAFAAISAVSTARRGDTTAVRPREGAALVRGRSDQLDVPDDGMYAIRVAASTDRPSRYLLRVTVVPPAPPLTTGPRIARVGSVLAATLRDGDPEDDDGDKYHEWTYTASKTQQLTISMQSEEFDTYLELGQGRGRSFEAIAENDDAGDNTNSKLVYRLPGAGTYIIRARALTPEDSGYYTLQVDTAAADARLARARRIRAGALEHGVLEENDATLEDGSWYDEWQYDAVAGESIAITMQAVDAGPTNAPFAARAATDPFSMRAARGQASTFDTFLIVGRMERGRFVELAINDDAVDPDGSTEPDRSRVVLTPARSGPLVIRANTFGPGQGGAYTLQLERGARTADMATRER